MREQGALTLEEAVRFMTLDAAQMYGLHDRGRLEVGLPADITVFDPATIGAGPVKTMFDLPARAARLYCDAVGVTDVLVNGQAIVNDGAYTGAFPGSVLRRGVDTSTAI